MNALKNILVTKLRDQNTSTPEFRHAAQELARILAHEIFDLLPTHNITITTPTNTQYTGEKTIDRVVLVPILRSGLVLLPAFLEVLPTARIGVIGLKRDEQTGVAHLYYKNLPKIDNDDYIIILDPMIATGGSGTDALTILTDAGIAQEKIIFVGVISTTTGLERLTKKFPQVRIITAVNDQTLNKNFFIVPGLGDFGDRFFGTL